MQKHLYVLDAEDNVLFAINGLQYDSDTYTDNFLGVAELTFTVNRYIWTPYPEPKLIESVGYGYLKEGMSLYVTDVGIFKITDVSLSNDSYEELKQVSASSVEYELQNRDLTSFIINEGITGSKEMMAEGNVTDAGLPKQNVSVYNKDNPELSFLDLVLDENPDWSIGEVDSRLYADGLLSVLPMEVDNGSVYSILMEEFAQNNKVVVTFDRKHRKVNCYSNFTLDYKNDTNIFIRFENLANAVNIERHNEGIFTRFNVSGGDSLSVNQVNLGEDRIEDLRWIVSQTSNGNNIYVTSDLAKKYYAWYEARETLRKEYVELSKSYNQYVININEIQTLDCMDALKIDLSTYKDDELSGLKDTYINSANLLVVAAKCAKYDSKGELVKDKDGYVVISDEDAFKASAYYTEWDLYKNTLIANIEIEQYNRKIKNDVSLSKDEKEKDYKDLITTWETQWDLYGIDTCETKKAVYETQLSTLKESNYQLTWDEAVATGVTNLNNETTWNNYHDEYVKIKEAYDGCVKRLEELYAKKAKMESEQSDVNAQRAKLVAEAQKTNEKYGFTESELLALSRLLIDTDYQNDSFATTSIDDAVTSLDVQEDLYEAAVEELEIESQEQLGFSVSLDNLFNIEEFKLWRSDFAVGNFIRVGVLDDYYVRLRIVSIQRSLFDSTSNDITVTFSNLLRSNGSLSDIDTLFDSLVTSTKNQIDATIRSDKTLSEIYLSDDILQALANSSVFQSSVTNIVADSIKANTGVFQAITSEYVGSSVIESAIANIGSATIDVLMSKYASSFQGDFVGINADTIKAGTLSVERLIIRPTEEQLVENPNIKSVIYEINNLGGITSESVDPDYADQLLINGKALVANSVTAVQIHAETITTDELASNAIKSRGYAASTNGGVFSANGTMFYLGDSSDTSKNTSYISSENFAIDTEGNAYFKGSGSFDGQITASSGYIASWKINEDNLYSTYTDPITGTLYETCLRSAPPSDSTSDVWHTLYVRYKAEGDSDYTTPFQLKSDGSLIASKGTIGGWKLTDTRLASSDSIYIGAKEAGLMLINESDKPFIHVQDASSNTLFKIEREGKMYAADAEIHDSSVEYTMKSHTAMMRQAGAGDYTHLAIITTTSDGETYYNDLLDPEGHRYWINTGDDAKLKTVTTTGAVTIGGDLMVSGMLTASGNSSLSWDIADGNTTATLRRSGDPSNGYGLAIAVGSTVNDLIDNTGKRTWYRSGDSINVAGITTTGNIVMNNATYLQMKNASGTARTIVNINSSADEVHFGNSYVSTVIYGTEVRIGSNVTCQTGLTVNGDFSAPYNPSLSWQIVSGSTNVTLRRSGSSSNGYGLALVVGSNINNLIDNSGKRTWYISGDDISAGAVTATGKVTANTLGVAGASEIRGTLSVTRAATLSSTLSVSGVATFSSNPVIKTLHGGSSYPVVGSSTDDSAYVSYIASHVNSSSVAYLGVYGKWDGSSWASKNIVSSASDIRLKENVEDSEVDALAVIKAIKMRQFDWKGNGYHQKVGFIADELEEVDSKLAFGGGYTEDGAMDTKTVDTFYLLGYVVKGMQEMQKEIDELKEKLATLRDK